MKMKERLALMDKTRAMQRARDAAYAAKEKARHRWQVAYAFQNAGEIEYRVTMTVKAVTVAEATAEAETMLTALTAEYGWQQWMIHDVRLLDDLVVVMEGGAKA